MKYRIRNKIVVPLLTLLGFSSACNFGRMEYGVPTAEFVINGKIVDSKTNKGIK